MRTRAITALVFVAVMLAGIFISPYSLAALFLAVISIALWEFHTLLLPDDAHKHVRRGVYTAYGVGCYIGMLVVTALPYDTHLFASVASVILLVLTALFIGELFGKAEKPFENVAKGVLGLFYIALPVSYFVGAFALIVRGDVLMHDAGLVFGIIALIWVNDTCALLAGRQFGRNKLFVRISPGKTWEGLAGGIIGTLLIAVLVPYVLPNTGLYRQHPLGCYDWLALGLIVCLFGTLGDLVESMLKRSVGAKDSGNLLPGHGGVLDRFDSFIFVLPFVIAYLLWVAA